MKLSASQASNRLAWAWLSWGIGRGSLGHLATRGEDNSKSRLLQSLISQSLFPKEYHVTVLFMIYASIMYYF